MPNMGMQLEQYFTPGMNVAPPPADLTLEDWFPAMMRRIDDFIGGYVHEFGTLGLNSWHRPFERQKQLFLAKRSTAAVSEHCFAAAADVDIPEEFRDRYAIDFFARVMKIDPKMRIGWLSYQKPGKRFTFFHAGFGFMVPFDVRKEYIYKHFDGKQAEQLYFRVNQSWKPEMRW